MGANEELEPADEKTGLNPRVVVAAIVGGLLALFIAQNTETTTVTWLVFDAEAPLWVVLIVTAAATLVITELIGGARRRRKRKGK